MLSSSKAVSVVDLRLSLRVDKSPKVVPRCIVLPSNCVVGVWAVAPITGSQLRPVRLEADFIIFDTLFARFDFKPYCIYQTVTHPFA